MKNVLALLLCTITFNGFAQQVVTYSFAPHQLLVSGDGFSELIIENCSYINEEGLPDIPVFSADILLLPGHEIEYLRIRNVEFYPLIDNISIRPASASFPISKGAPANYKPLPNPDIYNANKDYPESIFTGTNTSFLCGHAIGSFLIYPVIFNPVQKSAVQIKSITVEVFTVATPKATEALRFLRNDIKTAEKIIKTTTNRDQSILESYQSLGKRNNNPNYDMLIVTKQAFTSALNNYIAHKNLWGYKVMVKTVEEIYTSYAGVDNAEKVRNCVIDAYENEGISYLMLFGDSHPNNGMHNSLPYRKLYVNANNTIDELPSDMYFACLDGTWESGDGTWGKPGSEDLTHEISVGRICADNTAEIETFVSKLVKYQETPVVADIKKALMVGEMLNDNPLTWGGDCKDQIKTGGSYNGYTTVGIPSDFTVSTLYERDGNWSTSQLRNYYNNAGTHFVNHLGHSNVTYNMKLSNYQVTNTNFTNDGTQRMLAIAYSQGCYNGSFDNTDDWGYDVGEDCINEKFHQINGGVVANIGNSRYGWYNPGGTNGPSQRFDRYFFDAIFGKNIFTIGDANNYSKEIIKANVAVNSHLRWCCYELNLLGDPSMDIWTDIPSEFDPQYVNVVKENDLEFLVTTGVPMARVAILQNNELISRGLCDAEGNAHLSFDSPCDLAAATLSISGHNKYRFEIHGITFIDAPPVRELTDKVNENVVTLSWKEPEITDGNFPDFYAIYRDGIMIKKMPSDYLTYQDNDQLSWNTNYNYCVRAIYSIHASAPVCLPVKTDPFCDVVGNISSRVLGKTVVLEWIKPVLFLPEKYSIFRDGVFIKDAAKEKDFIIDQVPDDDTKYEYCVVARYEDCEPEQVCMDVIVGSPEGILEGEAEWFQMYPNPAHNELNIACGERQMEKIEIYDIMGRTIREMNINNTSQTVFSVSELKNGSYFLRIYTNEQVFVKRFAIIR